MRDPVSQNLHHAGQVESETFNGEPRSSRVPSWLVRLGVVAGVALAVFLLFYLTPLSPRDFTPTNVKNFILRFGLLAPVVFILLYALRGVILVIPVGVMSLAGGLAFGKWLGTVYILLGATLGSSLSFLVARYLGRDFIEKKLLKGKIRQLDERVEKNGFKIILFMRLVPLFQYDALNFGAGLSRVKFRDYFLATLIGMAPGGFINATLGESLENPLSVQFFVALGFFLLLMLVPTLYKKWKKSPAPVNSGQQSP